MLGQAFMVVVDDFLYRSKRSSVSEKWRINHIVQLRHFEFKVSRLIRVRYGDIELSRAIRQGKFRELSDTELTQLSASVGLTRINKDKIEESRRRKYTSASRSKTVKPAAKPSNHRRKR